MKGTRYGLHLSTGYSVFDRQRLMSLLHSLLRWLGLRQAGKRTFTLDDELLEHVQRLAEEEQIPTDQALSDLLAGAVNRRNQFQELADLWQTLSAREQQAVALVCLNYTYRQIGARLHVSSDSVKTYMHKAYTKLGVRDRGELRQKLAGWDFREWDR